MDVKNYTLIFLGDLYEVDVFLEDSLVVTYAGNDCWPSTRAFADGVVFLSSFLGSVAKIEYERVADIID